MANTRYGKAHKYNANPTATVAPVAGTGIGEGAYVFDALDVVTMFYVNQSISNGQANTTINDVFLCPQRMVVVKLVLVANGGAAAQATDSWNIVMGTGAEAGTVPAAQVLATAGQSVFAADKALTGFAVSTNYQTFSAVPDNVEGYWDAGTLMTLRIATGATAGVHFAVASGFSVQVFAPCAPLDAFPTKVSTANPATPDF
jgi:hypothetical protein